MGCFSCRMSGNANISSACGNDLIGPALEVLVLNVQDERLDSAIYPHEWPGGRRRCSVESNYSWTIGQWWWWWWQHCLCWWQSWQRWWSSTSWRQCRWASSWHKSLPACGSRRSPAWRIQQEGMMKTVMRWAASDSGACLTLSQTEKMRAIMRKMTQRQSPPIAQRQAMMRWAAGDSGACLTLSSTATLTDMLRQVTQCQSSPLAQHQKDPGGGQERKIMKVMRWEESNSGACLVQCLTQRHWGSRPSVSVLL